MTENKCRKIKEITIFALCLMTINYETYYCLSNEKVPLCKLSAFLMGKCLFETFALFARLENHFHD